jgi:energy-coupling factor transporter ATP-binding protein EcfA2
MNSYLQINDLTKLYGTTCALKDINLHVERGQVLALLGPNGAGKSTLFGCLLGFTLPTTGKILLHGRPLTDADRAGFGYAAERIALYPDRSVKDNAEFFAALKGLPCSEAERQVERMGLAGVQKRQSAPAFKRHVATARLGHCTVRSTAVARAGRTVQWPGPRAASHVAKHFARRAKAGSHPVDIDPHYVSHRTPGDPMWLFCFKAKSPLSEQSNTCVPATRTVTRSNRFIIKSPLRATQSSNN